MNATTNVGIPSMVQLHYRTVQQLNNVGFLHFNEGNPTEACECFRSALLVLQRLNRNLRTSRTSDDDSTSGDPLSKSCLTTETSTTSNPRSFLGVVRSGGCCGLPFDAVDKTMTLAASWDPVPMLGPMCLCEDKLFLAHCQSVGYEDDGNEDYSLIAMVLIFNLGATTQASAKDRPNKTGHDHTLNMALQLYRLVYDCIKVAQEHEVKSYQTEIARGQDNASAISIQRPHQQLISAFRQMMLLSVLHNMGLAYKHLDRQIEARQCHEYIFPALHYLREGLDSEHQNLLRLFDVDILIHGTMNELKVLQKKITAPCA
jgi:hypothetical protein